MKGVLYSVVAVAAGILHISSSSVHNDSLRCLHERFSFMYGTTVDMRSNTRMYIPPPPEVASPLEMSLRPFFAP